MVSDICPFFTNRAPDIKYKTFTSMGTVHEVLKHHQHCWRRPPPCDDRLSFHITFYELIDLSHEQELDGELWRSGRLHSDDESELEAFFGVKSRRMRESACTVRPIFYIFGFYSQVRYDLMYTRSSSFLIQLFFSIGPCCICARTALISMTKTTASNDMRHSQTRSKIEMLLEAWNS